MGIDHGGFDVFMTLIALGPCECHTHFPANGLQPKRAKAIERGCHGKSRIKSDLRPNPILILNPR
jgi:hypothetical protein